MSSVVDPNNDPNVGSSRGDASSTSGDIVSGLTGKVVPPQPRRW
ncbi:DUF221 domain protein [Penicillium maclennaniae]|nr:DUF221 domain protein [Penicillium maclennaniae]KAJ5664805.1 DUF221 domain protein [Penicillium maclennaniae]